MEQIVRGTTPSLIIDFSEVTEIYSNEANR